MGRIPHRNTYDAVAPLVKLHALAPPVLQVLFGEPRSTFEIAAWAVVPSLDTWCAQHRDDGSAPPTITTTEEQRAILAAFATISHRFAWDDEARRWTGAPDGPPAMSATGLGPNDR